MTQHRWRSPRNWTLIILAANLVHLWLFFHLDSPYSLLVWIAMAVHVAACVGPFWMLVDWFVKKHHYHWKTWMWLFFVPWGFLWYYFEIHRLMKEERSKPRLAL
jgi:hypothetical protein